jgi:hypothetical protein
MASLALSLPAANVAVSTVSAEKRARSNIWWSNVLIHHMAIITADHNNHTQKTTKTCHIQASRRLFYP